MKVLQLGKFYYPYMGGMENHLYQLCNELQNVVDLDVVVANTGATGERSTVNGVSVTRCAEVAHIASTSICPTMTMELSRRRYDVLHLHFPHPMGAFAYVTSRKPRRHALVVTHHSDVIRQRQLAKVYAPFMRAVLRRADLILSTSPNYRDTSEELAPYRDKCEVVPYGIDLAQFVPTAEMESRARGIRAKFSGHLILAVGRLIPYKGFEYIIDAMPAIDGQLLLIGDGPLRASLESRARALGVAERVHFLGNVHNHDVTPYYFASDLYALPSITRNEAFAIVQLEAMACGRPVVNTSLDSGVPFVSRHGESGFTVPPRDPAALATAVKTLLANPELRMRMGAEGKRRVAAEFSKEHMARRIRDCYARAYQTRVARPA